MRGSGARDVCWGSRRGFGDGTFRLASSLVLSLPQARSDEQTVADASTGARSGSDSSWPLPSLPLLGAPAGHQLPSFPSSPKGSRVPFLSGSYDVGELHSSDGAFQSEALAVSGMRPGMNLGIASRGVHHLSMSASPPPAPQLVFPGILDWETQMSSHQSQRRVVCVASGGFSQVLPPAVPRLGNHSGHAPSYTAAREDLGGCCDLWMGSQEELLGDLVAQLGHLDSSPASDYIIRDDVPSSWPPFPAAIQDTYPASREPSPQEDVSPSTSPLPGLGPPESTCAPPDAPRVFGCAAAPRDRSSLDLACPMNLSLDGEAEQRLPSEAHHKTRAEMFRGDSLPLGLGPPEVKSKDFSKNSTETTGCSQVIQAQPLCDTSISSSLCPILQHEADLGGLAGVRGAVQLSSAGPHVIETANIANNGFIPCDVEISRLRGVLEQLARNS